VIVVDQLSIQWGRVQKQQGARGVTGVAGNLLACISLSQQFLIHFSHNSTLGPVAKEYNIVYGIVAVIVVLAAVVVILVIVAVIVIVVGAIVKSDTLFAPIKLPTTLSLSIWFCGVKSCSMTSDQTMNMLYIYFKD